MIGKTLVGNTQSHVGLLEDGQCKTENAGVRYSVNKFEFIRSWVAGLPSNNRVSRASSSTAANLNLILSRAEKINHFNIGNHNFRTDAQR